MPRTVPGKLAEYARDWGELGVKAWNRGWWELPVEVGNEIAPLINAGDGEIVMMPNVTIAQTAVISAMDFPRNRDTVVMTELDFPSVRYMYTEMAERLGARVVVVRSDDGLTIDPDNAAARDLLLSYRRLAADDDERAQQEDEHDREGGRAQPAAQSPCPGPARPPVSRTGHSAAASCGEATGVVCEPLAGPSLGWPVAATLAVLAPLVLAGTASRFSLILAALPRRSRR